MVRRKFTVGCVLLRSHARYAMGPDGDHTHQRIRH